MNKNYKELSLTDFTHDSSWFFVKKEKHMYYPPHGHNYIEFELIINGKGTQILNGQRYEYKPGTLTLLLPTDIHELIFEEEAQIINVSFLSLKIPSPYIHILDSKNKNFTCQLEEQEFEKAKHLFNLFYEEFTDKRQYFDSNIKKLLSILFSISSRNMNFSQKDIAKENPISYAIAYMKLYLNKNISLTKVAKRVDLHPVYFSALFKKQTGKTYSEYITELKISYAKKLIRLSSKPVLDISLDCGFNSISNFNRKFKEKVGMSPIQYRKQANPNLKISKN